MIVATGEELGLTEIGVDVGVKLGLTVGGEDWGAFVGTLDGDSVSTDAVDLVYGGFDEKTSR